jgi:hypothetical protein
MPDYITNSLINRPNYTVPTPSFFIIHYNLTSQAYSIKTEPIIGYTTDRQRRRWRKDVNYDGAAVVPAEEVRQFLRRASARLITRGREVLRVIVSWWMP